MVLFFYSFLLSCLSHFSNREMPSKWFKSEHTFRSEAGVDCNVLIIYLDTFSLDEKETEEMLSFVPFSGYKSQREVDAIFAELKREKAKQVEWLNKTFEEADDPGKAFDYKIVCAHFFLS